jgi:superoxide dismutase, Fe-Mn family
MKLYEEKKFNIPELSGIGAVQIEEHLKLYKGYVKNTNGILEKIQELSKDSSNNAYTIGELQRRLGFEFNGMRNHEYYFQSFEGGSTPLPEGSKLQKHIEETYGSFDAWFTQFNSIAKTRGVGWAILYFDTHNENLIHTWVDEQHLGQLMSLEPVLCLDMWEHAFLGDYLPSQKQDYIDAFFKNINWEVIESNFEKAQA